jgi:hypothetical protein
MKMTVPVFVNVTIDDSGLKSSDDLAYASKYRHIYKLYHPVLILGLTENSRSIYFEDISKENDRKISPWRHE